MSAGCEPERAVSAVSLSELQLRHNVVWRVSLRSLTSLTRYKTLSGGFDCDVVKLGVVIVERRDVCVFGGEKPHVLEIVELWLQMGLGFVWLLGGGLGDSFGTSSDNGVEEVRRNFAPQQIGWFGRTSPDQDQPQLVILESFKSTLFVLSLS